MSLTNLDKQFAAERAQGEEEVRAKHPDVLEIVPSFSQGALILDCKLPALPPEREWTKYLWREDY